MNLQILSILMVVLIFSNLTNQQTAPIDRCSNDGNSYVCLDCFRIGNCTVKNGEIIVEYDSDCSTDPQTYCDDTLNSPANYGTCTPISGSTTNCSCSSSTQCIADPNNPATVLHCESDPPVTSPPCIPASAIDLTTCSCASCSGACPLVDNPNDDCASYFVCDGTGLTPQSCIDGCFNQTLCGCAERGTTTTSATPTISPDCNLRDDPTDNCSKLFYDDGTNLIPLECPNNQCFDQSLCGCVSQGTATTTTTTISPNCGIFFDDPDDDCSSYFLKNGTDLIPLKCVDPYCFDDVSCSCTDSGGSGTTSSSITTTTATATTTTTSSGTCPPGCPFIDDPSSCGGFFICDEGQNVAAECPGILCFDQASCACV